MTDAGFSLVELLIAVTILAIIVIPLLHMFVTSTRINVKSRQMLRATTVAQDIMEGLKAYTLEDVQEQFSLPDGKYSSAFFYPTEGFYIVNSSMIQGGVREIRGLETERNADGTFKNPNDPDNEIYYFGIQNLKMQGGEYDALIKLDASTYTKAKVKGVGGSGPSDDAHKNDFNGRYYADVTSISETNGSNEKDSSYHEDKEFNANALKLIKKHIESSGQALPDGWDEMTEWEFSGGADKIVLTDRTIEVVLEQAKDPFNNPIKDEEGNLQCMAKITIKYTCKFGGDEYTIKFGVDEHKISVNSGLGTDAVKPIPRTFTSGNFYLFYYPIYALGNEVDNIVLTVNDAPTLLDEDEPLLRSITLAKQIRSTVNTTANTIEPEMSDGRLWESENSYRAHVMVNANPANKLVFKTNADTNMAQAAKHVEDDGSVYWDDLPGVRFDYADPSMEKKDIIGENVSDKATNVIYDIEISVYKAGAAQYFDDPHFEDADFAHKDDVVRLVTITNLD